MKKKALPIEAEEVLKQLRMAPATLGQLAFRMGLTEKDGPRLGSVLQRLKRERRVRKEKVIGWVAQTICPNCKGTGVVE